MSASPRTAAVAFAVLVALSLIALPAAAQLPQNYRIDVIQTTTGVYYGADINDHGEAALAARSPTDPFNYGATRWDRENGFIPLAPAAERSLATGINKRGDVTVVYDAPGEYRHLSGLWSDGQLTDLGTIGRQTFAEDVNDQGVVVGWTERDTDQRERYAFTWTREGGLKTLPGLSDGRTTNAIEITENDLIVGYSYGPRGQEAVRWVNGRIEGLGDFAGGWYESAAMSANERGQIVGVGHIEGDGSDLNGDGRPDSPARAFLWTEERGMINLGALGPDHNSVAYDINEDGIVVGYSIRRPGGTAIQFTPFVWTEESGMVDLHTMLDPAFSGWRLGGFQMGRINDQGQILLHGEYYGQFSEVILTPQNPEPGALLALAAACTVLSLRRRG